MRNNSEPWVVGISASHNGAVCLLKGDEIVVAIQEERLTRKKRHRIYGARPSLALDYCLDYAGIQLRDLSMIVLCAQGRSKSPEHDLTLNPSLQVIENAIPTLIIPHHYGHAVGAFATSGFKESAVLIVDGMGSPYEDMFEDERKVVKEHVENGWETISLYRASDTTISALEKHMVENGNWLSKDGDSMLKFGSLGGIFSAVAMQIFGSGMEAGKVMGLAPYGQPSIPVSEFFEIIDGRFLFSDKVPLRFKYRARWPQQETEYENLAASAQHSVEEALLYLVNHLYGLCPSDNLCYAGGVALNSIANERIIGESNFKNFYIMPAAEDSGPAIGAAYHGLWQLTNKNTRRQLIHDAVGREYPPFAISRAIAETPGVESIDCSDVVSDAAHLLAQGKIVGWFQGRSELGPRALGQRSIIYDPRRGDGKEILNSRVKHREAFRPFAPVILLEEVLNWFDIDAANPESRFMLRVCKFKADKQALVPAVVHVDGTGRVQTITKEANGRFYDLVERFHEETGVPIILNTSFNVMGMPIVETPEDALRCFLSTDIDYCVLGDVIVKKRECILLGLDAISEEHPARTMSTGRSLGHYSGIYKDLRGEILTIEEHQGLLKAIYKDFSTSLARSLDDTFNVTGGLFEEYQVSFMPDKHGFIERAIIYMGTNGEATFIRATEPRILSETFKSKCVGVYQAADKQLQVSLSDANELMVTIAGQPPYVLIPGKGEKFDLKNTPGYSIEFKMNAQEADTHIIVTQPNGVFTLRKVL